MQTTHPGTIQLDGDAATGRTYMHELARTRWVRNMLPALDLATGQITYRIRERSAGASSWPSSS